MLGSDDREDPQTSKWHLDRRVNLSIIITIVLQCVVFGFYAGQTSAAVETLQEQVAALQNTQERLTRVETQLDGANTLLNRIDTRLERLEDRL